MKKRLILLLLTAMSFGANAQTESGMFFQADLGTRFGGATSDQVTLGPGFYSSGAIGYMFNNFIGIRGQLAFNKFNSVSVADEGITDESAMFSTKLEAIVGLSQLIGFGTERFDLYLHTGFGFCTFANASYKEEYREENEAFNDRMFKGNDEAFTLPFGITPTFHINEKVSVHLDATYSLILGQGNSIDRSIGNVKLEDNSGISNLSIGLTYRL